jgi:tight adherence protein B
LIATFALALGLAAAALLLMPGAAALLQGWARALLRSRERTLDTGLSDAFVFIESQQFGWALAALVAAVTVAVLAATASGLVASAAGALVLLVPAAVSRRLQSRRRQRLLAQLPDALDLLAASLRAGLSLVPAIQHLASHQPAPLAQELALIVRRQRLGRSLEEALEVMRERIGGSELALFATAVAVARELGGNLSDVLCRLAQTLREKQAIERKIDALTAQGRLQARIIGLLPLALLVIMTQMAPRAMHLMFTTPPGWAALLALLVLEATGLLLLRRQVRIDV